ncbi:MAG: hypothetical protein K6T90_07205 [Leptolyngbyaceae cyanobacterium HOT.MB2.61]|nr:hypothetical protein [Leptolyngbyaceae cyanobacterium HOT.MB2.61]
MGKRRGWGKTGALLHSRQRSLPLSSLSSSDFLLRETTTLEAYNDFPI